MPQVKPEITAVSNNIEIIPPEIKVIKPIPLRIYRAAKQSREIKNTLSNIDDNFSAKALIILAIKS